MRSKPEEILRQYWGYDAFRPPQDRIIDAVLGGKDTLALLPTGGGKSICFQVPGMAMEGITLVISPLISLMKDQVENLKKRGIKASAIHTGMPFFIMENELNNCVAGHHKFLYLSPERLKTPRFLEFFRHMKVNLIAVDEAHCISQWGYDFRPVYLEIAEIRKFHPKVPVLALTATATPQVANDICEKLHFAKKNIIGKSFARENLVYVVSPSEKKEVKILQWLEAVKGTAIVYTRNRQLTKKFSEFLNARGISADYYHAGLEHEIREKKQKDWMNNRFRVIVATNAFGMGIDKPDVRLVLHTDVPESPEAYFQEAGRAGRDGKVAYAVLPTVPSDKKVLEGRFQEEFPEKKEILRVYKALCNHLQIPVGSGQGEEFKFSPDQLAGQYGLTPGAVFRALKILEKERYLYLNESAYEVSSLRLKLNTRALYDFMVRQPKYESFIQTVLRSYGGLFDDFVRISEVKLAGRLKRPTADVLDMLEKLHKLEVWEYRRASNLPSVTLLIPRIPEADFILNPKSYGLLKKNARHRYDTMIGYITEKKLCHSVFLLRYFGEENPEDCDRCDVCRKKRGRLDSEFSRIWGSLTEAISHTAQKDFADAKSLLAAFGIKESELALQCLDLAVDEGYLIFHPAKGYHLPE